MSGRSRARRAVGADLVDVRALVAIAREKADQAHDALSAANARLDAAEADLALARSAIIDLRARVTALEG